MTLEASISLLHWYYLNFTQKQIYFYILLSDWGSPADEKKDGVAAALCVQWPEGGGDGVQRHGWSLKTGVMNFGDDPDRFCWKDCCDFCQKRLIFQHLLHT